MSSPKHDIGLATPWIVNRRVVVGTLAAASAVSLVPLAGVTAAGLPPSPSTPFLVDWHIDDQWGPRYAEPIACGSCTTGDAVADGWSAI